jgi:hypothetical protein
MAVNCLLDIVQNTTAPAASRVDAASILLSPELFIDTPGYEAGAIVDEDDAPFIPCDCPVCAGDIDVSTDVSSDVPNDVPTILRYEVFFQ